MSNLWVNRVKKMFHIRNSARLVLYMLADMANEDGMCWPSLAYISSIAGISRRQVIRAINELEKSEGIRVKVEHRFNQDRKYISNMYYLVLDESFGCVPTIVPEKDPNSSPEKFNPPGAVASHQPDRDILPSVIVTSCHKDSDIVSRRLMKKCHYDSDKTSLKTSLETKSDPLIKQLWNSYMETIRGKSIYEKACSVHVEQDDCILRLTCPKDSRALLESRLGAYIQRYFAPYVNQVLFIEQGIPIQT